MTQQVLRPSLRKAPQQEPCATPARLRVGLAIGSEVIALGVRRLLGNTPSITLESDLTADCDVILVDGPAARGHLGNQIRRLRPAPAVVGLRPNGIPCDPDVVRHLDPIRWIPLSVTAEELASELRAAYRDRHGVDANPAVPARLEACLNADLTTREDEILALIGAGLTNQEIAGQLFLSINSVKSHIRTLYQKIGTTRRSQAVAWGWARGY